MDIWRRAGRLGHSKRKVFVTVKVVRDWDYCFLRWLKWNPLYCRMSGVVAPPVCMECYIRDEIMSKGLDLRTERNLSTRSSLSASTDLHLFMLRLLSSWRWVLSRKFWLLVSRLWICWLHTPRVAKLVRYWWYIFSKSNVGIKILPCNESVLGSILRWWVASDFRSSEFAEARCHSWEGKR